MKRQIINLYLGVSNWLKYVRSYKENKENDSISDHKIMEQRKKIEKLKKEIESYKYLENERINLLQLRENRIDELSKKYGEIKKNNKSLQECIWNMQEQLQKKEHERRVNAATLGAKQKRINNLERIIKEMQERHNEEILSKDATIEYLKRHRRAPSVEEIKAYELQQKEVEKRIKENDRQPNNNI